MYVGRNAAVFYILFKSPNVVNNFTINTFKLYFYIYYPSFMQCLFVSINMQIVRTRAFHSELYANCSLSICYIKRVTCVPISHSAMSFWL